MADYGDIDAKATRSALDRADGSTVAPLAGDETRFEGPYQERNEAAAATSCSGIDRLRKKLVAFRTIEYDLGLTPELAQVHAALESIASGARDAIADLWETLNARLDDLEVFRRQHNRLEDPQNSSHLPLQVAFLFLMLLFETLLNGTYVAPYLEGGVVAGAGFALGLAIGNLGCGVFVGCFSLRAIAHRSAMLRVFLGLVGTSVLVAWAISFNLGIAHYRDLLVLGEADPGLEALLETMRVGPFDLQGESFVLFWLGLVFFLVAVVDCFSMSDRYLGYGKRGRRVETPKLELRGVVHGTVAALNQLKGGAPARFHDVYLREEARVKKMEGFLDDITSHAEAYENKRANFEEALGNEIANFRATFCDVAVSRGNAVVGEFPGEPTLPCQLTRAYGDGWLEKLTRVVSEEKDRLGRLETRVEHASATIAARVDSEVQWLEGCLPASPPPRRTNNERESAPEPAADAGPSSGLRPETQELPFVDGQTDDPQHHQEELL